MELESLDDLIKEALSDADVRHSYKEHALRRHLAAALNRAREERGLSVRELAAKMKTSTSQVQRLLHEEVGGSVTLATLVRAADALDLRVEVHVRPQQQGHGVILQMGGTGWTPTTEAEADAEVVAKSAPLAQVDEPSGDWKAAVDGALPVAAVGG